MRLLIVAVLPSLLTLPAVADVMVVRSIQNDGMMGMGASKKESTTWISGQRHREELKGEGKPSMLERMAGVGRPVITRLDKNIVWTLNDPKKRYEERPLVVPTEQSKSEPTEESKDEDRKPEKPTTKITKAEFKVTPIGQKKTINGFNCDGYQLKALIEIEDLETKKRSEMRLINTLWNAPETGAVAQLKKEELDYAKAYAKALGLTDSAQKDIAALGTTMIAAMAGAGEKELSGALAKMPAELRKIKGYPIHTRVEWYGQGDEMAEAEQSDQPEPEDNVEIPTSVGEALGGFASGFAKKKMAEKKPKPVKTKDGRLIMAMTSEIKSISTSSIPAERFEVPAGYKKTN